MIFKLYEDMVDENRVLFFWNDLERIMVRGAAGNELFVFVPNAWELSCVQV